MTDSVLQFWRQLSVRSAQEREWVNSLLNGVEVRSPATYCRVWKSWVAWIRGNRTIRHAVPEQTVDKFNFQIAQCRTEDHAISTIGARGQAYHEHFLKLDEC